MSYAKTIFLSLLFTFVFLQNITIYADGTESHDEHKLVIQINTDDIRAQKTALTNIVNLQKHYGMDNIEIELVAFGSGYRMLTPESTLAPKIASLLLQEVTFTACMNTMLTVKEKTGFMPKLIKGVTTTKAGVARIIELQEQNYSYVKEILIKSIRI